MSDKRAKMLERVRALLAKADSTTFSDEADAFRAKADVLMAQYAIEQWQVDAAQQGVGARPEPEVREVAVNWWYDSKQGQELYGLFRNVAYHCRCVVAYRGHTYRRMPLIGLPSDLDYMDMLFTHLMLQMGKGLEPRLKPGQTYTEALVMMKEAGMNWKRIGELLIDAGLMQGEYTRNVGVRFTKEYSTYCRENNKPQQRVFPSVYQRSFAIGFIQEIEDRMRKMRRDAEKTETTGTGLALRDIRQASKDLYDVAFPDDEDAFKGGKVSVNVKLHEGAYNAGSSAGKEADISGSPQRGLRNQKEIGS